MSIFIGSMINISRLQAKDTWLWVDGTQQLSLQKNQHSKDIQQRCSKQSKAFIQQIQRQLKYSLHIEILHPKEIQGCVDLSCAHTRMKLAGVKQSVVSDYICMPKLQIFKFSLVNFQGKQLVIQKTISQKALKKDHYLLRNYAVKTSNKLIQGPGIKTKKVVRKKHDYAIQFAWHHLSPAQAVAHGSSLAFEYAYHDIKKRSEYVLGIEHQVLKGSQWLSLSDGVYVGYRKRWPSENLAPVWGGGLQIAYQQRLQLTLQQRKISPLFRLEQWNKESEQTIMISPYVEGGFYWLGKTLQPHLLFRAYLVSIIPFDLYQGSISLIGGLRW